MTEIDNTIIGGGGGGASTQSNSIDSKASVLSGYSLSTSAQTIVGAINEIYPKATGVGKIDPNSDGTGEIFNTYEGDSANTASGLYSHAEGYGTRASGEYSHVEGYGTRASGEYSHAEGCRTMANSYASHAEGSGTTAIGRCSHTEGLGTQATGFYSHAEGNATTAIGYYSHVEGNGTRAMNSYEHAEGQYNVSNTGNTTTVRTRHSVGIGTKSNDRRNAHEIMANGDHYIYGLGGYDGTNATSEDSKTLQTVVTELQSKQTVYTEVPELTADYNVPANDTFVEHLYIIPVGATLFNVTGDAAIKWAGGVTPSVSANSILVVSVLNNLATWQTFI